MLSKRIDSDVLLRRGLGLARLGSGRHVTLL
jgi:hypothetical protein